MSLNLTEEKGGSYLGSSLCNWTTKLINAGKNKFSLFLNQLLIVVMNFNWTQSAWLCGVLFICLFLFFESVAQVEARESLDSGTQSGLCDFGLTKCSGCTLQSMIIIIMDLFFLLPSPLTPFLCPYLFLRSFPLFVILFFLPLSPPLPPVQVASPSSLSYQLKFLLIILIEIQLLYNIVLVSDVQHSDSTFVYIVKCSPW